MTRKPVAVSMGNKTPRPKESEAAASRKPRTMPAPKIEEAEDVFDPVSTDYHGEKSNHFSSIQKGARWGALFVTCMFALVSLGVGLWLTELIERLYSRSEWLGWAASGLVVVALIAFFLLIAREIIALWRLRKLGSVREDVERALQSDGSGSGETLAAIIGLYRNRKDMKWNLSRLKTESEGIFDDQDRLVLAERTLMKPLDGEAKSVIAAAAKRIAVVTAVNPAPSLDILFTGYQILRMLRQITYLYGSRPGSIGTLRLAGMIGSHLAVTGGLALSDTLVQQFVGKGLAGRLSAKLGEGTVNGILTARIGLAAVELCRPMPFEAVDRPGLRDFLAAIAGTKPPKGAHE